MKSSARRSATAALSAASEGSPKTSQSSQMLVSRTRRRSGLCTRTSLAEHHQLRGAALLDEHDGVLAEDAPERLRVVAVDADHQAARLDPGSLRLAALARAPWIARGGDELVECRQRGGVLLRRLRLAARVRRGDERGGGRAFRLEQGVEPAARLAALSHHGGGGGDPRGRGFFGG